MAFDLLQFESGCPLSQQWIGRNYKIHQLYCRGHQYRVCSDGFLWRVSSTPSQVPFHGDLVLQSETLALVARFYSGALEWVRPYEELSELAKEIVALQSRAQPCFLDGSPSGVLLPCGEN